MRLLCPIHLDLIGGESLQLPFLIAVLRALCVNRSFDGQEFIPFGNSPVFASAIIDLENGSLGPVERLHEKLAGFIRELGENRPAVLTREQIETLRANYPHDLEKVQVHQADSLTELLFLVECKRALLDHAMTAYHPSMNERLLNMIHTRACAIDFSDAQAISRWMLSQT